MTPSAFFERIRSAVLAFWREDTSPKKRRTDSGEEALLSAEISATRSKVVSCLFFVGLVAVLGKAFWLQCGISTDFLQNRVRRAMPARFPCPHSAVRFSIATAWFWLPPFRRAASGLSPKKR